MQFPFEPKIFGFPIDTHFLFETLGMVIGFRYYLHLRKKSNDTISDYNRIMILVGAGLGAFVFSRLVGALENPERWFASENMLIYFFTNKTIVGGLTGGLIGVETMKKIIGEKKSSGDLLVFPICLAMIIGRIGCFMQGLQEETYGIATELPWGIDLGDGLRRHPVTLYEILWLALFMLLLRIVINKTALRSGIQFKYFMIFYLTFRFLIDFIKPVYQYSIGISAIQITCIAVLLYYSRTIYQTLFNRQLIYEKNG